MEHKTVDGAGGKVHYWISKPKCTAKDTIVFTHGLTANHTMFEKQTEFFEKEYTVVTWDVPLHGLSAPYSGFSYENAARDLNLILEQEQIEKVCLAGMSMGGYPSQMFAHIYPNKTKCLIGIDTTPFGTEYYSGADMWWLSRVKPMAKLFPDKILRKSMAKTIARTKYSYRKMLEMLAPLSKTQIIEQMDIAYGRFSKENKDLQYTCPVLILLGDKDKTGKVKQYCHAWAKAAGYPLHIIKNAAHFANGDNPTQVNREIEEFVNQINAAGEKAPEAAADIKTDL